MKGKFPNGLKAAMEKAKVGPTELARLVDTSKQNVQRWADQERKLPQEWAEKLAPHLHTDPESLFFPRKRTFVPVGGIIGAGGEVDTKVSQAYGDEAAEVEIDIPLPPGMVAFEVWGDSMLPKYDPGDFIVVSSSPAPPELIIGDIALVLTDDGRRYVKRVLLGSEPGLYHLESFNARPMLNVRVAEFGMIYLVLPAKQVRRRAVETKITARRARRPRKLQAAE